MVFYDVCYRSTLTLTISICLQMICVKKQPSPFSKRVKLNRGGKMCGDKTSTWLLQMDLDVLHKLNCQLVLLFIKSRVY